MEMRSTRSWVFRDFTSDNAMMAHYVRQQMKSYIGYRQLHGTHIATAYNLEFDLAANAQGFPHYVFQHLAQAIEGLLQLEDQMWRSRSLTA